MSSRRSEDSKERITRMRTVKSLVDELSRFPDEALCHAYEGEVTGIVVRYGGGEGVIHCSARGRSAIANVQCCSTLEFHPASLRDDGAECMPMSPIDQPIMQLELRGACAWCFRRPGI